MNLKVLLTSTDNPYLTHQGGKHIHLLLLENGLERKGLESTTLYYDRSGRKEFFKRALIQLLPQKLRYKTKISLMVRYLRKHFPTCQFDIIHAHDVISLLAVGSKPQKKVLTLHGYFARENVEFIKGEKNRKAIFPFLLQKEREAVKLADRIITVDQRLKDYVVSEFSYPPDRVDVMHNAVYTDQFRPIEECDQRTMKAAHGFNPDNLLILVPRRLVEKNGVIYAVRAMKHLESKNLRMFIVGDGPERSRIAREIGDDNRVTMIGLVPHVDIPLYYEMADIVLIPSVTSHGIQEASSLSMLEAMASGKPAICSNIGGMRDIIRHMQTGILVEEAQPEQIAEAVNLLADNPELRFKIGKQGRKYVLQNHSHTTHTSKVCQVYLKTLGTRENDSFNFDANLQPIQVHPQIC